MASYQYKVVPFIGKIKSGQSADEVGTQLQSLIDKFSRNGWEFHQMSDINIEVTPGCLQGLFGAKISYVKFDQLIFRKES